MQDSKPLADDIQRMQDSAPADSHGMPGPMIFNLCVSAEARRAGVASNLVSRCEEICQRWGASDIFLKVSDNDKAAHAFAERAGFGLAETRHAAATEQSSMLLMQKPLESRVQEREALRLPSAVVKASANAAVSPVTVAAQRVVDQGDLDAFLWLALGWMRGTTEAVAPAMVWILVPIVYELTLSWS